MKTQKFQADESFNQVIIELYKKTQLPLKASQLVTRYSEAVFKVKHTTPNFDDSTYQVVAQMNFQAVSEQIRNLRLKILDQWQNRLVDDLSIEKCLPQLTVKLLDGKVSQKFIDKLHTLFDFQKPFSCETEQISKMFDDLQMLFLKITESIMESYELKDEFKSHIKDEIEKVRKDLGQFCKQHLEGFREEMGNQFKKAVQSNPFEVPKSSDMNKIKSSFRKYKDKLKNKIKANWMLTESVMKLPLQSEHLSIKNQLSKALHNKADFELKTKPKIYLLVSRNGNDPRFDFLKNDLKKQLMDILCLVLHQFNTTAQAKQNLRSLILRLSQFGIQYDYNKLFEGSEKLVESNWNPPSEEINLLVMINLFLLFNSQYTCYSRSFLKHAFRQFKNFVNGYSNFKVLLCLQNMDIKSAQTMDKLTVSTIFESQSVPYTRQSSTNTSKLSEATTNYSKRFSLVQPQKPRASILQLLRMQQSNFANKQIQILATTINVHKLNREFKKLPLIEFQKISNPKTRSRVITICISGFTSQEDLKDESWRNFIKQYEGEIFAMNWESKSAKDMIKFAMKRVEGLLVNRVFNAVPIMNVMTIVGTLTEAFQNNPFFSAMDESIASGKMLGHLLPEIFPGCLINLVGFSLGTEVIKQCLRVLKRYKCESMINKVLLMGGVADCDQLKKILTDAPIEVINTHSDKDHVLKILFRICKPLNKPCGLGPIEGKLVQNIDCTEFIEGHNKYRAQFEQICRRFELQDDTQYYYGANP